LNSIVIAGPHLSGAQLVKVRDAIVSAYFKWEQIDELVAVALDIDLEAEIGRTGGLKEIARNLLKLTEASGTTEMLLREAVHRRPGNVQLRKVAHAMGLAPAPFTNVRLSAPAAVAPGGGAAFGMFVSANENLLAAPDADGYEAMVRPGGTEKPGQWRRTMIERERPVCQILLDGDAVGTGFLVAPDLVMSNHHVFEMPGTGGQLGALARYSARFDYRASDPGAVFSQGTTVGIDASAGYLDKSPKSELDYAIVRLVQRSGKDVMPGEKPRGWLTLDVVKLAVSDPAFVLQHPRGRTLELAVGSITGWEAERGEEIYEHSANTDEGSSGSPCFSWQWALRALHHRVDPKTGRVNRAIATTAILERMAAVGTIRLLP
jgi:hypothetical protein